MLKKRCNYLVKGEIKHLAKIRGRELKKQRQGHLDILSVRQAYLTNKLNEGNTSLLAQLIEVKLKVAKWCENESKTIILTSRFRDINENEKV